MEELIDKMEELIDKMGDIKMDYDKMTKEELIEEINKLKKNASKLEKEFVINREDKLKLEILKKVPFTMWACDREFKIILWTCGSAFVYKYNKKEAIGKNYLELFVDPLEIEHSKKDCIEIIEDDMKQVDFIAIDLSKNGGRPMLATNCFRIWDEVTQDYLQAEVSLDITNIQEKMSEYNECRVNWAIEIGKKEKTLNSYKGSLVNRLKEIHEDKFRSFIHKEDERKNYITEIRKIKRDEEVNKLKFEYDKKNGKLKKALDANENHLKTRILDAKTVEELDELDKKISRYNIKSLKEIENELE